MLSIRDVARVLPVGMGVGGRGQAMALRCIDAMSPAAAGTTSIQTAYGPLRLDRAHGPERILRYFFYNVLRHYETSPLAHALADMARPGAVFVDVGSNLGAYLLIARRLGYRTVGVEPEPRHGAFLRRNPAVFGTVLDLALSDRDGVLPLHYNPANPGATSLVPDPTYRRSGRTVAVTTFSALAAAGTFGDPAAIRLVKIDVEGAEDRVAAGMAAFLSAGHRPAVWCEVRGGRSTRNPDSWRPVAALFGRFGYRPFDVADGGTSPADGDGFAGREVFDLLFRPVGAGGG